MPNVKSRESPRQLCQGQQFKIDEVNRLRKSWRCQFVAMSQFDGINFKLPSFAVSCHATKCTTCHLNRSRHAIYEVNLNCCLWQYCDILCHLSYAIYLIPCHLDLPSDFVKSCKSNKCTTCQLALVKWDVVEPILVTSLSAIIISFKLLSCSVPWGKTRRLT